MKIVSYLGSPRKNGCTATVLSWVEDELRKMGHEVERIEVADHDIHGCISCYTCKSVADEIGCVFKGKDDGVALWNKAVDSDLLILASPLYCWGFASQIKAFIDRCFALVKDYGPAEPKSLLAGRKAALLMTCAGPIEGNADHMDRIFTRLTNYLQVANAGDLIVPGCSTPDALGDEVRITATSFARDVIG